VVANVMPLGDGVCLGVGGLVCDLPHTGKQGAGEDAF
jgi:hypothetical protein